MLSIDVCGAQLILPTDPCKHVEVWREVCTCRTETDSCHPFIQLLGSCRGDQKLPASDPARVLLPTRAVVLFCVEVDVQVGHVLVI